MLIVKTTVTLANKPNFRSANDRRPANASTPVDARLTQYPIKRQAMAKFPCLRTKLKTFPMNHRAALLGLPRRFIGFARLAFFVLSAIRHADKS
jgi:hypothetical protein